MIGSQSRRWVQRRGLAIVWHNNVELKFLSAHLNICHFETTIGEKEIDITCVYGAVEANEKITQWSHILELSKQVKKPWVLIGDLNIILDPGEEQGGHSTSSSSKTFVTQIIDSLGLQDAGYEGAPFTWSNNRSGEANICERINRALISYQWIQMFHNTKVSHLTRVGSDHTLILFDSNPETKRLNKPFGCLRSWLSHPT